MVSVIEANVTQLLSAVGSGDRAALATLLPLIYKDLRQHAGYLMQRERAGHTLQPTALVHEAFLRLVQQEHSDWQSRAHFFAIASQVMRRILVDHARAHRSAKRGGGADRISLSEGLGLSVTRDADVLAIDAALTRLAAVDARQAEIVSLRFFGGLSVAEVAKVLDISTRTVEAEWTMIKAWLRRELTVE